jgi:hypothetical protein
LARFVFPNLVSFDLSIGSRDAFKISQLLDFLEASPMLRTVHMTIAYSTSEDVSEERIVILPNVENFNLIANTNGDAFIDVPGHVSCPSVRFRSLTLKDEAVDDDDIDKCMWEYVHPRCMKSPVEEVVVEIEASNTMTAKVTFRYADAAVTELRFKAHEPSPYMCRETLTDSTKMVLDHPHLANAKSLRVCHNFLPFYSLKIPHIADNIGKLFKSMGPLDELTIYHCDLRPYFHSSLISRKGAVKGSVKKSVKKSVVFPPARVLSFLHPLSVSDQECTAIVELAKSHHALGIPFERVVFRGGEIFKGMEEKLGPWVGSVEYYYEEPDDQSMKVKAKTTPAR